MSKKSKHQTKMYKGEKKSANTQKSICMGQLAVPPAAAWPMDLNASFLLMQLQLENESAASKHLVSRATRCSQK